MINKMLVHFILLIACQQIYPQDSIVFSQSNSRMFSNKYVFFKNNTFKYYFQTDDGQLWFGIGTYKDKGCKRILRFKDADLNYKMELGLIHYESNFQRILIKFGKKYKSADYYYTSRKKNIFFEEIKPNN